MIICINLTLAAVIWQRGHNPHASAVTRVTAELDHPCIDALALIGLPPFASTFAVSDLFAYVCVVVVVVFFFGGGLVMNYHGRLK